MIKFIIFSKDRPAQLDALLRSIEKYYPECVGIVIFKGDGYENFYHYGYSDEGATMKSLKDIVLDIMDSKYTAFLVDDMQFIDRFRAAGKEFYEFARRDDIACLSLRLGVNINYSYPKQKEIDTPFPVEGMLRQAPELLEWEWMAYEDYWGYPMSMDGHIFKTKDIKPLIEAIDFDTPNELEGQLALTPINKPYMICYDKPKVVNYPFNIVTTTCENRNMNIPAELLNESFRAGHRLKLMQPVNHRSCHVEQYPEWE